MARQQRSASRRGASRRRRLAASSFVAADPNTINCTGVTICACEGEHAPKANEARAIKKIKYLRTTRVLFENGCSKRNTELSPTQITGFLAHSSQSHGSSRHVTAGLSKVATSARRFVSLLPSVPTTPTLFSAVATPRQHAAAKLLKFFRSKRISIPWVAGSNSAGIATRKPFFLFSVRWLVVSHRFEIG